MDEYQDIKELLKLRREINATAKLRQRIREASAKRRLMERRKLWQWSSAVAACVTFVLATTVLFKSNINSNENSNCIVYVAGKQVCGTDARDIAEADFAKIDKFLQTIKAQQTAEKNKVQQFINHYNTINK